jgi:hypothetical protein
MHSMGIDAADAKRGGQLGGVCVTWHAEDVLSAHNEIERGAPFCSNPSCDLHVRLTDLQVESGGNWASLPDGRVFGRGRYGSRMLCDACGTRRGPVRLETRLRLSR